MNKTFIELTTEELLSIDGGKKNWLKIAGGALICVGSVMSFPASGDITTVIGVSSGIGGIVDGL